MSYHRTVGLVVVAFLLLFALVGDTALAEVPRKINYQMRITDTDTGEPLPGSHSMTFRIYDSELGGGLLWTEGHSVTADTSGVVSVILGSMNPIGISFDGPRWLQVEVNAEVLSPRRELVSVPYAINAEVSEYASNADSLGGFAAEAFIQDGHSLDADDGSPVDALYVGQHGYVGIGTTSPAFKLHIVEEGVENTEIFLETTDADDNTWQGVTFSDEGQGAGIRAYDNDHSFNPGEMLFYNDRDGDMVFSAGGYGWLRLTENGNVGLGTENPSQKLHVNGHIQANGLFLGDSAATGALYVHQYDQVIPVVEIHGQGLGGTIDLRDENGSEHSVFQPDGSSGGGGYAHLRKNNSLLGIILDGNYNGTESPKISFLGYVAATFDMSTTDDASVVLPARSISAFETLEEPGVASAREHYTPATALSMSSGYNTLASKTITTPADGFVLAIGSAQPTISHSNGTDSQAEFGVSDASGSLPENQDCLLMIHSSNPTGVYTFPVTVHGLFEVGSAGSHTFHFIGRLASGTYTANDVQFTLVYFASNHGSVSPTFAGAGQPDFSVEAEGTAFSKEEEIAREQAEAERAHRERVERELAEMREQIEALRREMEANPNGG